MLAVLDKIVIELDKLDKMIGKVARNNHVCRRLMSVPGVGKLTAISFMALVDDPIRFSRNRDAGAYLGLTPKRYKSGETDRNGSISKWGDQMTRQFLYTAANVLMGTVRQRSDLKSWGLRLRKRLGAK